MTMHRDALAAPVAALFSLFSTAGLQAATIPVSVDLSAHVIAQSLWTHTFLYDGPAAHDLLHLNIPTLQAGLLGVPPRRTGLSITETAEADARVDVAITHPDGSMTQGLFEYGWRGFETQVLSGSALLGIIQPGGTMPWIDTLPAEGTTHGFERGCFAFLGDPFGEEVSAGNLKETIPSSAGAPEANPSARILLGFAGLSLRHGRQAASPRSAPGA